MQGQFSINLAGTGMKISNTAKWLAQGRYASVIIHRSQVSPVELKCLEIASMLWTSTKVPNLRGKYI